jgi:hypothetical protein
VSQLRFYKCLVVRCNTLLCGPRICPACKAYFLSLPSDAEIARGATWPEPAL